MGRRRMAGKKLRQRGAEVTFTIEAPSMSADFLFVSLRPIIMSVVRA